MEDLEKIFFQSFTNKVITSAEKRTLKLLLQQTQADEHTKAWLRSRCFDWAKAVVTDSQSLSLLKWLEEANKLLLPKTEAKQIAKVYFSPGEECLEAILYQLKTAVHTIKICVFTISDDRITDAVIACHHMGKKVLIITDNEKLHDTGSDIRRLEEAGILVKIDRTTDHMHHKFAIIDERIVLTGSYNWTRSAAKYNHENILITEDIHVVEAFQKEFQRLWLNLDEF
jgi:phosphatidylserine/phosphatidylglycerophosphate/cardiolipin synthase-like enzyme